MNNCTASNFVARRLHSSAPDHEEIDHFPMPTPDQVARSVARFLQFRDVARDQSERDLQIAEGRKMARSEAQAPRHPHNEGHDHYDHRERREFQPFQPASFGFEAPAKKRRNRNRNKNASFAHASA